jgi:hypothetical protein
MTAIIDWFWFQIEFLYWYFHDFLKYNPEDIDTCCRR